MFFYHCIYITFYKKLYLNKTEIQRMEKKRDDYAMSYMVSAEDIKKMLGHNIKIIRFPDLVEYNSMEQVLPYPNDCAILFFIDEMNQNQAIGHWTCIMRNGKQYEFFDSYGLDSKEDLEHISEEKRIKFGEQRNYLKELGGGALKHNPVQYQGWDPKVATCGRFSIIRLLAFMAGITNPKEFYRFMRDAKKQYNCKSFDELAVMLTSNATA
jgi:hypothetical protein